MQIKCSSCGEWFDAARLDAKYCSPVCRKRASRVTDNPEEALVTDNGEQKLAVTDNLEGADVTDKEKVMIALEASGKKAAKRKQEALLATDLPEISLDTPCNTGLSPEVPGEIFLDVEKDLGLSLKKDLGCYSWSRDGIMIRPDITVQQVQNIARLIHAKNGRPCPPFHEATNL
jgi:hypothetical protein